ncbi:hypothetical protein CGRA01v4_14851 [Colletotrichum graminicola]|nr:hypothetical protein CGRA01v4_14851 [Colletotrichum graminicola]
MQERAGSWRSRATCVVSQSGAVVRSNNNHLVVGIVSNHSPAGGAPDRQDEETNRHASVQSCRNAKRYLKCRPQWRVEVERRPPRFAARHDIAGNKDTKAGSLPPSPTHVPLVLVTQLYVAQHCRPFRFVRLCLFAPPPTAVV